MLQVRQTSGEVKLGGLHAEVGSQSKNNALFDVNPSWPCLTGYPAYLFYGSVGVLLHGGIDLSEFRKGAGGPTCLILPVARGA